MLVYNSCTMIQLLRRVQDRMVWTHKMDDLYQEEDPLQGEAFPSEQPSMSAHRSVVPKARFSDAPATRPASVHNQTIARPFSFGSSRSNRASSKWNRVRQATDAARAAGLSGKSSSAIVAKLGGESCDVPNGQVAGKGIASAEASSSWAHAQKKVTVPWENEQLLARRALRRDALHSRIVSLDEKIRARKAESSIEQTFEKSLPPPQHTVDWCKRPSTVATMVAVPPRAGADPEEMPLQRERAAGHVSHLQRLLELPSDIELDAMDPVVALAKLQDIEEHLIRGIQGVRQSVHDRIRCVASPSVNTLMLRNADCTASMNPVAGSIPTEQAGPSELCYSKRRTLLSHRKVTSCHQPRISCWRQ